MNIIQTIILAIVEGLTEFLPISSTGHLILMDHILNVAQTEFIKSFEIFIQLGAILAVTVIYFRYLLENKQLWLKIMTAFIPTGIIGLLLYKIIKQFLLGNELVTVISLFVGGIALLIFDKYFANKQTNNKSVEQLTYKQCLTIGTIQAISVIPGVSRAAATIIGGLSTGLNRKDAVKFSFLLAIPTMAAASGLDLLKSGFSYSSDEYILLIIGFVVAFITALGVIKYFLKYIQNNTFTPFAIYRIIFAVVYFVIFIR